MSMTANFNLLFLEELWKAQHNLTGTSPHTLKMALMNTSFAFDPTANTTYSMLSGLELAAGNGYTAGGIALAGVDITITDNGDGTATFDLTCTNNPTWTGDGGDMATAGGLIIYNDSHSNKTVAVGAEFDVGHTAENGKMLQIDMSNGVCSMTVSTSLAGGGEPE